MSCEVTLEQHAQKNGGKIPYTLDLRYFSGVEDAGSAKQITLVTEGLKISPRLHKRTRFALTQTSESGTTLEAVIGLPSQRSCDEEEVIILHATLKDGTQILVEKHIPPVLPIIKLPEMSVFLTPGSSVTIFESGDAYAKVNRQ